MLQLEQKRSIPAQEREGRAEARFLGAADSDLRGWFDRSKARLDRKRSRKEAFGAGDGRLGKCWGLEGAGAKERSLREAVGREVWGVVGLGL